MGLSRRTLRMSDAARTNKTMSTPENSKTSMTPPRSAPCGGSASVDRLFVVIYKHARKLYRTVVIAQDIDRAKRKFRRENPDVEIISCC